MTIDTRKTPAERRNDARREAFVNNVSKLATNLILLPLDAFVLMLAIGAAHGFAPAVPAIGYGTTILLVLGADTLSTVTKKFRN
jgi:hypothetical protein